MDQAPFKKKQRTFLDGACTGQRPVYAIRLFIVSDPFVPANISSSLPVDFSKETSLV
jgi:hypothetical protein